MLRPVDYALIAVVLLTASAILFIMSRAVLAQFRFWRQAVAILRVIRALLPLWFAREMLIAKVRGRPTRLVKKRYRSLRRRAWEHAIEDFFVRVEPVGADQLRFTSAILCALAGGAAGWLFVVPL